MRPRKFMLPTLAAAVIAALTAPDVEQVPPVRREPEQSPEDAAEQLSRAERRRRARALKRSKR